VARRAQVAMWAWGAHVYTRPHTLVPPPHTPHTARRCPAAPRVRATRRCVGPGSDGGSTHRGECEKDQRPGTSKGRLKGRPTSRIALRFSTVSLSPTSSVTMRSSSVVTVSCICRDRPGASVREEVNFRRVWTRRWPVVRAHLQWPTVRRKSRHWRWRDFRRCFCRAHAQHAQHMLGTAPEQTYYDVPLVRAVRAVVAAPVTFLAALEAYSP
jgi:hypothetical protein